MKWLENGVKTPGLNCHRLTLHVMSVIFGNMKCQIKWYLEDIDL